MDDRKGLKESALLNFVKDMTEKKCGPVFIRLVKRRYEESEGPFRGSFLKHFRENSELFNVIKGEKRGLDRVEVKSVEGLEDEKTCSVSKLQKKVQELENQVISKDKELSACKKEIEELRGELFMKNKKIKNLERALGLEEYEVVVEESVF